VLGATEGQGGAVVDALLARGRRVRALLQAPASRSARRLAEQDVDVVAGSFEDTESLAVAMQGVSCVRADHAVRGRRARRGPLGGGGAGQILAGVLELPLSSDRPLQQLARPDLGAFAAEVLAHPDRYLSKRIELASDVPTPHR